MRKCTWKIGCNLLIFCMSILFVTGFLGIESRAEERELINVSVFGSYDRDDAQEVFQLVNEFRTGGDAWYWDENNEKKVTDLNLEELTYDYDLQKIAEQRAAEIALAYSHERPDGTMCFTAFEKSGKEYLRMSENIAVGQLTSKEVMEDWKEELDPYEGQGHRRNMLDGDVNAMGAACFNVDNTIFWVQEFAKTENPNTSSSDDKVYAGEYVSVEVDISEESGTVLSNIRAVPSIIGLDPTGGRAVPGVSADILTANSYQGKVPVEIENLVWSSSDTDIVNVEEIVDRMMIRAQGQLGNTVVSTTIAGKTITVKVCVTEDGEIDPETQGVIPIDEEHFPDDAFRQYVSSYIDTAEQGFLTQDHCSIISEMRLYDDYGIISDLTGIEYFSQLSVLEVSGHRIQNFDISGNPNLEILELNDCDQLKSIDLSSSVNLNYVRLDHLPKLEKMLWPEEKDLSGISLEDVPVIKNIDQSGNENLSSFSCKKQTFDSLIFDGCTKLTELYVTDSGLKTLSLDGCTSLKNIDCSDNALTHLDVSGMRQLQKLECRRNQLESLNLEENVRLVELDCRENQLKTLDVSGFSRLETLYCQDNQLTSLQIGNDALTCLYCSNNPLKRLNLNGCPGLKALFCDGCPLLELDVSNNPNMVHLCCCGNDEAKYSTIKGLNQLTELQILYAEEGNLTSLDVSQCKKLKILDVTANEKISSIDIRNCKQLLQCCLGGTALKTVDLSQNTELMELNVVETPLTQLNLSTNTNLRSIEAWDCQLTSLDVSSCKKLIFLDCDNNKLTKLNLKGCTDLFSLKCSGNSLFGLDISTNKKIGAISFTELLYEDEVGNQVQQHYSGNIKDVDLDELIQGDYEDFLIDYDCRYYNPDLYEEKENSTEDPAESEETEALAEILSDDMENAQIMDADSDMELYVVQYFDVPASAIIGGSIDLTKMVDVTGFDPKKIGKMHHVAVQGTKLVMTGAVNRMYFDYYTPVFFNEYAQVEIPFRLVFRLTEGAQEKLIDNMSYPSVQNYTGVYDGKNHTVTLEDIPKDATVQYRTSENASWSNVKPVRKNVGVTRVYCKISQPNWKDQFDFGDIIIKPKGTSIKKITAGKSFFTVKWKKQAAETTGYQIRYSTKASMAGAKMKTIAKNKTVSQKITKLKRKKNYYVQIRTYKKVGGNMFYSTWSKKKKIKVK